VFAPLGFVPGSPPEPDRGGADPKRAQSANLRPCARGRFKGGDLADSARRSTHRAAHEIQHKYPGLEVSSRSAGGAPPRGDSSSSAKSLAQSHAGFKGASRRSQTENLTA